MKRGTKIGSLVLVGCLVLGMMTGCGKETKEAKAKVDMKQLKESMLSTNDELPEMKTITTKDKNSEELFASLADIEYDKIQDYFYSYAADGSASEVAVVFVRDKKDVEDVLDALREHKEDRIKTYQNYAPDQVETAEQSVVFAKGNYAAFIMNEKFSHIKATFESAMEESE